MPNSIEYVKNYTSILDRVYQRASVSGCLNSGRRMVRAERNAKEMPRYRAAVMRDGKKVWLNWCEGLYCTDGCDDTYAGIPGAGIVDVEFDGGSLGPNGWYSKNMDDDKLIGLTVYYDTPRLDATGYYQAKYRVRWMSRPSEWGKWEYDNDDGGAGNDTDQLDMIELTIVPC